MRSTMLTAAGGYCPRPQPGFLPLPAMMRTGDGLPAGASTPKAVANARKGLLSEEALDTLFASEVEDLRLSCTCPDSAYACKHIVAVGDRLATRADADPAVIFNMRGLDFARLEKAVMEQSQQVSRESFGASDLSAEEKNDVFWNGREMPK